MNYQHLYHAGNFADVFKHVVLITLIDFLKKKETPFCYLETHAGQGIYDLTIARQKTKEVEGGIQKLLDEIEDEKHDKKDKIDQIDLSKIPPEILTYLKIVKDSGYPNFYPGSPLIAKECLRPNDQLILCEKNSGAFNHLKQLFHRQSTVAVHHQDGFLGLKAFLPPKQKRGLILIDPPYEQATEWKQIIEGLKIALSKFPTGVYAVWYPIKDKFYPQTFLSDLQKLPCQSITNIEFNLMSDDPNPLSPMGERARVRGNIPFGLGLQKCGIAVLNPPWKFEDRIKDYLPSLQEYLKPRAT